MTLKATNFRYPAGARPLLFEETARRRARERRFEALLEAAGFAEIILPVIDYAEPYAAVATRDTARRSYRFTDREGELVTLRCDFTPMLARALAPTLRDARLPLRVFYRGEVVRCEPTTLDAGTERFQIGAEIVGDASVGADIAMLQLAATLARATGAEPLVAFGDVMPEAEPRERQRAIESAVAADRAFVLQNDDLEEDAGYYTSLRFHVFDRRSRRLLAIGGRYDSLYGSFGNDMSAVGFTFTLAELETEAGA